MPRKRFTPEQTIQNLREAEVLHALRPIHESYSQAISVDELASRVALSDSAFHLHFKKITSYSPLQYLKGIRLTKARELIQRGQSAVNEAARSVGYESPSQFGREYKRFFDCPPSHAFPSRE